MSTLVGIVSATRGAVHGRGLHLLALLADWLGDLAELEELGTEATEAASGSDFLDALLGVAVLAHVEHEQETYARAEREATRTMMADVIGHLAEQLGEQVEHRDQQEALAQ
jgi:hypothetical protein